MNRSKLRTYLKWPLLLVLAVAAGLWFFGEETSPPITPENMYDSREKTISFKIIPDSSKVEIHGLSQDVLQYVGRRTANLSEILSVYALSDSQWSEDAIPTDGMWNISKQSLEFSSRHNWLPGVEYYVRLDAPKLAATFDNPDAGTVIDTSFTISRASDLEPQQVAAVYPSADTLPQNLLKFYIHFSGPMSREDSYNHIYILDEDGEMVPDAFLELPQELWDPHATRLTILFDPGRIKRGLARHNLMGVAFEPGKEYTLVVDSTMTDGNGLPTGQRFEKTFTITSPDRQMPDPGQWTIIPPASGLREALQVTLDEPMDHALLKRLIKVEYCGKELFGNVETTQSEQQWRFIPDEPWQPGSYTLQIEPIMEDLAGNNLISVFDVVVSDSSNSLPSAQSKSKNRPPVIMNFDIPFPG